MKETIVYIGNFSFPKNNSAGIRVLNNGYLFRSLGYAVTFIGLNKAVVKCEGSKPACNEYDGFKYYEFPYPKGLKDWLFFFTQLREVIEILKKIKPTAVIAYGSMSNAFFALFLSYWCRFNNVKFITDCVDWLAGASGGRLFRIGKRLDTELQKRYVNAIGDGVIAVSSFLAEYYKSKSCKTLVLPPLSKTTAQHSKISVFKKEKCISIAYAGFPFPTDRKVKNRSFFKDRLDTKIELLSQQDKDKFIFDIYGLSLSEYLRSVPEHKTLLKHMSGSVRFHGVVSNDVVLDRVSKVDYFFLFRDSNRMTNAGFPSKIAEAISLGVPVITTATSDISSYIINGTNGYILVNDNFQTSVAELTRIFNQHEEKFEKLKKSCVVNNPFEIERFSDNTREFMKSI